jgi:hypothetical protein
MCDVAADQCRSRRRLDPPPRDGWVQLNGEPLARAGSSMNSASLHKDRKFLFEAPRLSA